MVDWWKADLWIGELVEEVRQKGWMSDLSNMEQWGWMEEVILEKGCNGGWWMLDWWRESDKKVGCRVVEMIESLSSGLSRVFSSKVYFSQMCFSKVYFSKMYVSFKVDFLKGWMSKS